MPRKSPKSPWRHLAWILPLLALDFFLFRGLAAGRGGCARHPDAADDGTTTTALAAAKASADAEPPPPPPPVWQEFHTPTPQTALLTPEAPGVLQPTASGRLRSAMFGSTRTGSAGGRLVPRFHEGVDIAATERDRRGAPTDEVFAIADGKVAFVNNVSGNSSYGKYVVVEHPDPSLGVTVRRDGSQVPATVYSLYAHLSDIRFGVRAGADVQAGETLGTMGNTSNDRAGIPMARAHLHWEMGLLLHRRYDRFACEQKLTNPMGSYNGLNLFGVDPLAVYHAHVNDPGWTMASHLTNMAPACVLALRGKYPDYFVRYPGLWQGAPYAGGPIRVALGESGIPLSGRNATASETAQLGNSRQAVLSVDETVLGRNARAYVRKQNGRWIVTDKGRAWMQQFFY